MSGMKIGTVPVDIMGQTLQAGLGPRQWMRLEAETALTKPQFLARFMTGLVDLSLGDGDVLVVFWAGLTRAQPTLTLDAACEIAEKLGMDRVAELAAQILEATGVLDQFKKAAEDLAAGAEAPVAEDPPAAGTGSGAGLGAGSSSATTPPPSGT